MGLFGKARDDKPKKLTPKVLWEQYYKATQEQQWSEAVEALKQLRRREPGSAKIPMKLGDALQRMGNRRDAVAAYHDAAEATERSGFAQKALAIYKIILRLDPRDGRAQERSREIVEGIESASQQQALPEPAAAPSVEAPAFESYGSLDMPAATAEEEAPPEGLEPTVQEPEAGPEPDAAFEPVPGLELTSYEEPDEEPEIERLITPEPEPEVETAPGLEQTAYEDEGEEPLAPDEAAQPEGLEPTTLVEEEPGAAGAPEVAAQEFRLPEVFAFLMPQEQEEFLAKARLVPYAHGDVVIREGENGDTMYIVRSGTFRVVTDIMGREVELALLGPGDFFGEVAFLTGRPRTASVVAMGNAELYEIDKPLLQETIDLNPLILDGLVELYHSRAQDTVEKIKGGNR